MKPYIRRDGETNPDNLVAHRQALMRLSVQAAALCAAWVLTKDHKCADRAADHFRAGFIDPSTLMNPNLQLHKPFMAALRGGGPESPTLCNWWTRFVAPRPSPLPALCPAATSRRYNNGSRTICFG